MSGWQKRTTTIYADHPKYDERWASLNRTRARSGQPPIPHGEPLEIVIHERIPDRPGPLGIGYCRQCNEVMLVNDEQQKWCPTCRAERKRYYTEKYRKHNHED